LSVHRVHIKPLTTLRFLAAFWVVLFHTLPDKYRAFAHKSVLLGYSSVSFFFILSGFVLALAYAKRLDSLDRREFWRARFARIYPLFMVTLCLDLPNLLLARIAKSGLFSAIAHTAVTLFATIFMLQAWWPQRLEGLDNPNWSLSVEAVFYLLFPWIAAFLWRRTARTACALLLASYACGIGLVIFGMRVHLPEETLFYLPVLHISEFVSGILTARIFAWFMTSERRHVILKRLAAPVLCGTLACFYCLIRWPGLVPKPILHDGGLTIVFAPLILVFASGQRFIDTCFSKPLFVTLGEASYGLYLIHMVLWHYTERFVKGMNLGWKYSLYLFTAVILSILTYQLLEQPARRWILLRQKAQKFETPLTSDLAQ
jgi:peptidoglycan/LPS O-acetylase OafA/YrhL